MEIISVRIDKIPQIDEFTKVLNENRSSTIRELLEHGRRMKALELYKQKKVSLGKAAKLAGLTLSEFIELLKEFSLTLNIELDDVKQSLEYARKLL
ncbi:UPF0175 family protein [Candidatus Woesearchaeota archaeon]|nr:UPF0175 family protein [Candidatus Woesearchaeota archaeon]